MILQVIETGILIKYQTWGTTSLITNGYTWLNNTPFKWMLGKYSSVPLETNTHSFISIYDIDSLATIRNGEWLGKLTRFWTNYV